MFFFRGKTSLSRYIFFYWYICELHTPIPFLNVLTRFLAGFEFDLNGRFLPRTRCLMLSERTNKGVVAAISIEEDVRNSKSARKRVKKGTKCYSLHLPMKKYEFLPKYGSLSKGRCRHGKRKKDVWKILYSDFPLRVL